MVGAVVGGAVVVVGGLVVGGPRLLVVVGAWVVLVVLGTVVGGAVVGEGPLVVLGRMLVWVAAIPLVVALPPPMVGRVGSVPSSWGAAWAAVVVAPHDPSVQVERVGEPPASCTPSTRPMAPAATVVAAHGWRAT